jgi:hypothetical protein
MADSVAEFLQLAQRVVLLVRSLNDLFGDRAVSLSNRTRATLSPRIGTESENKKPRPQQ